MKKNYIKILVTFLLALVGQVTSAQISETVTQPIDWSVFNDNLAGCTDTDIIDGVCVQINWSNTAYNDLVSRENALRNAASSQLQAWFSAQTPEITNAIENKYNKNFSSYDAAKDYHFEQITKSQFNSYVERALGGKEIISATIDLNDIGVNISLLSGPSSNPADHTREYFTNFRQENGRFSDMDNPNYLKNELIKFYNGVDIRDQDRFIDYTKTYANIREGVAKEMKKYMEDKYNSKNTFDRIDYMAETIQYPERFNAVYANAILFTDSQAKSFIEAYRIKNSLTIQRIAIANLWLEPANDYDVSSFAAEADAYLDKLEDAKHERIYENDFTKAFEQETFWYLTNDTMKYFRENMYSLIEDLDGNYESLIGNLDPDAVVPIMYDLYEDKRIEYKLIREVAQANNGGIPVWNTNYENYYAFEQLIKNDLPEVLEEMGNKKLLDNVYAGQSFQSTLEILKTASIATTNKKEKVYLGTGSGSTITYTFAGESGVNSGTVNFNYVPDMSSFFHNHYAGGTAGQGNLLSTFSNQDVMEFFSIAAYDLMDDADDFTMLVVTPQQDLQAVMISDATVFEAKIAELTAGDATDPNVTIGGKTLLEFRLDQLLNQIGNKYVDNIVPNIDSSLSASKLNDILKDLGLSVYQYNSLLDKWFKQ